MAVELRMPSLGMTMEEGKVVAWRVREGERVSRGQIVVEIEAEKAAYELEAPVDGIIGQILVAADDVVPVGRALVSILGVEEQAPARAGASPPVPSAPAPAAPAVAGPPAAAPSARRRLSPRARALAESLGVDVQTVVGTGPEGTVVEKDIRDAAARVVQQPSGEAAPFTLAALGSMRRTIAGRMVQSVREAPHFFLAVEVDGSALGAWRDAHADRLGAESGVALTLTDLLAAATARALRAHPWLNASWAPEGIRQWREVNLGLAVAVEGGLIVPVLRRADRKPIAELMRERHDLVTRARARKLRPGDLEGGTFTLSNLGGLGIDVFTSILNPPEAGILSVGALRERPVVVEGRVVARPTAFVGLTIDHRVTDGAAGARFLQELKTRIEAARLED